MTTLRTGRALGLSASPARMCSLSLVLILTASLSISCDSYRNECLHNWSVRRGLQANPVGRVGGDYKNESIEPFIKNYNSMWKWLTDRPSEPTDVVHIAIDSEARTLSAALIRHDTEVDRTTLRYRDAGLYLRLQDRYYGRFEKFPLVHGVDHVELAVGRNREGLSLYMCSSGSWYIVVVPAGSGGGPGDSLTFEPVQP